MTNTVDKWNSKRAASLFFAISGTSLALTAAVVALDILATFAHALTGLSVFHATNRLLNPALPWVVATCALMVTSPLMILITYVIIPDLARIATIHIRRCRST